MKKRILFTIPNFNTAGSGKAMLNIALGLDPEKFEAHIACQSDKGDFFNVVKQSGIPVHVFNYIAKSRPIPTLIKECWQVSRRFKEIGADVIHSFHYSDNYTEGLAARLAGAKWVFTKKNMSWGGSSGGGWKLRSALAAGIAVQNTDMISQFYPTSKKTMLISRGVVVSQFLPQAPKPSIRQLMHTEADKRLVICVANMVPVKGVELLLQAFQDLATEFPNWDLWLVGDINNDYGKQLLDIVKKENLETRVHFSGKQPNVRDYLDHAEIFVLPTKDEGRREGSPVALLESMANGKVVIGSAVPGVKDQLKNFQDHQFQPGNWQSLRDRLAPLFANTTAENQRLGQKFQELAIADYDIAREIKQHEMFYIEVLR